LDVRRSRPALPLVILGILIGAVVLIFVVALVPMLLSSLRAPVGPLPTPPLAPQPAPAVSLDVPGRPNPDMKDNPPPDRAVPTPPFEVDPALEGADLVVYLTDLQEFDVRMGPWTLGKHGILGDPYDHRIVVNSVESPHGIGMHPTPAREGSAACYALGGKAAVFKGAVAYNDYEGPCGPGRFWVLGDGKVLWRSETVRTRKSTQAFSVDVSGVRVLEIQARGESNVDGSHGVWLEPRLFKTRAEAEREQP
jgi:hypothetical protein